MMACKVHASPRSVTALPYLLSSLVITRNRSCVAALCVAACLAFPAVSGAQCADSSTLEPPASNVVRPEDGSFWAPFAAIPGDFVQFVSPDTLRVLAVGGTGALAAHP